MFRLKVYLKKVFFVFVLILTSLSCLNASVEVFSNYDTVLTVNTDNTIDINRSLTLKNVYEVGIVPGQIEFKVAKGVDGSVDNLKVMNVSAKDKFGKDIKVQVREMKDYSVIILDVYYPLLPGFEYQFDLDYKLSYNPGGIFFKSLNIPIRESTIPIEKGAFRVVLPDNYHFTYFGEKVNVNKETNSAIWDIKDNDPKSITFEYSYLPIKIKNFKGSYTFWIVINLILLLILFFEVKKEVKKVKNKYGQ